MHKNRQHDHGQSFSQQHHFRPRRKIDGGRPQGFLSGHPLDRYEYIRIPLKLIPQAIIDLYDLESIAVNSCVFAEVQQGMNGLPQAGILVNKLLQRSSPRTHHPRALEARHTQYILALVVDNFGVIYTNCNDAIHLIATLQEVGYKVSQDWTGTHYGRGLTIAWDYDAGTVTLSMPGYVERALQHFNHPIPTHSEHSPHAWNQPQYGAKIQYAAAPDTSPILNAANKTRMQEVLGVSLFYARAVDVTMLKAIGTIATQQSAPTKATVQAITKLLNYAATHPDAELQYTSRDMILWIDSDASFLSKTKSCSTCAGYYNLSNKLNNPSQPPQPHDAVPMYNALIFVICNVMKEVVSATSEAELTGLFHNGKEACPIRTCLIELGHPQPPTPIKTDNTTAEGLTNNTVKQKQSKAIDMTSTGARPNSTGPIISRNTIRQNIIRTCAMNTFIKAISPTTKIIMQRSSATTATRMTTIQIMRCTSLPTFKSDLLNQQSARQPPRVRVCGSTIMRHQ